MRSLGVGMRWECVSNGGYSVGGEITWLRGRERGVYRGDIFWIARGSIVAILLLKQIWMRREFYITILT